MDRINALVEKLRGMIRLHPEMIRYSIVPRLKDVNPESIVNVCLHAPCYRKDKEDQYVEVSLANYSVLEGRSWYLAAELNKHQTAAVVDILVKASELLLNPKCHELYKRGTILLKGGKTQDFHYFIGVAFPTGSQ